MIQKMLKIFFFTVLIGACTAQTQTESSFSNLEDECIPPLVEGTYPIEFDSTKEPVDVLPGRPWQEVSRLPEIKVEGARSLYDKLFIPPGKDEIWIIRQYYTREGMPRIQANDFWIFNVSTGDWREIHNALDMFSGFWSFFYSSDGNIWGMGESDQFDLIFGKYDEAQRKLVKITFETPVSEGNTLFDKHRNVFWIFSKKSGGALDKIYKVMLESKEIETLVVPRQLENFYNSADIAPDGSIYMLVAKNMERGQNSIIKFIPETQALEEIKNPIKDDEFYSSLFIDHSGNLWLNDHSKRSADGEWYQILRSPIFITDRLREMNDQYIWDFPRIRHESSNGFLWFGSLNGLAWHNPESGKWCWVTTKQTYLAEDDHQVMWLTVNGRLYKYPLKP